MTKKDEFYIGYLDAAPSGIKAFTRKKVIIIGLIFIIAAIGFAIGQKHFANSSFELGKLTEIEGTYFNDPYHMLRVEANGGNYKNLLLLGFGKFGADKKLEELENITSLSLEGQKLVLKGTLIYYNGKTLLQLDDDITSSVTGSGGTPSKPRERTKLGSIHLKGEIIDPKCYFGVMKPGLGKIHRSCASRCISGGIPPVFVTTNSNGDSDYFLITDQNGDKLKDDILKFVGKGVSLKGTLEQLEDWHILKVDPADIMEISKYSDIYVDQ